MISPGRLAELEGKIRANTLTAAEREELATGQDTDNSVYRDFHRSKRVDPNNFATTPLRVAANSEQQDVVPDAYSDIPITKAKRPAPGSTLAKTIAASSKDDNPFAGMQIDASLNPRGDLVRGPDGSGFSYERK